MAAKEILHRYIRRRPPAQHTDPLKLREHLASVAQKDGLKVTDKELDDLVAEILPKAQKEKTAEKPKSSRKKAANKKTGSSAS